MTALLPRWGRGTLCQLGHLPVPVALCTECCCPGASRASPGLSLQLVPLSPAPAQSSHCARPALAVPVPRVSPGCSVSLGGGLGAVLEGRGLCDAHGCHMPGLLPVTVTSREGRWAKELWGLAGPGEPGTAAVPRRLPCRPRCRGGGSPRPHPTRGSVPGGSLSTPNPGVGLGGQWVPRWRQDGALQMCRAPRCAAAERQPLAGPGGCRGSLPAPRTPAWPWAMPERGRPSPAPGAHLAQGRAGAVPSAGDEP